MVNKADIGFCSLDLHQRRAGTGDYSLESTIGTGEDDAPLMLGPHWIGIHRNVDDRRNCAQQRTSRSYCLLYYHGRTVGLRCSSSSPGRACRSRNSRRRRAWCRRTRRYADESRWSGQPRRPPLKQAKRLETVDFPNAPTKLADIERAVPRKWNATRASIDIKQIIAERSLLIIAPVLVRLTRTWRATAHSANNSTASPSYRGP